MIQSFRDKETAKIFSRELSTKLQHDIQRTAQRKLRWIHTATSLEDLKSPPGNELEKLKKDRKGQHSIRINKKWRVCFRWEDGNAYDVEITDYH